MMSLGVEIKQARARKRIYANALAKEVGISPKYLSQIEADKAPGVTAEVVRKIALALGVSADRLLGLPSHKEEE